MATLSFPTSPVSLGATTLQATIFNTLLTDYARADFNAVSAFRRNRPSMRGLPELKTGVIPENWTFLLRKDMISASAPMRNLIGIKTTRVVQNLSGYSPVIGRILNLPVEIVREEVYNWYPSKVLLADSTALLVWTVGGISFESVIDPESGDVMTSNSSHEHVYEALGLAFQQVAANPPTLVPFFTALSGLSPV